MLWRRSTPNNGTSSTVTQSDVVNAEAEPNPHFLYSATLDFGSADLSQFDNLQTTVVIDLD